MLHDSMEDVIFYIFGNFLISNSITFYTSITKFCFEFHFGEFCIEEVKNLTWIKSNDVFIYPHIQEQDSQKSQQVELPPTFLRQVQASPTQNRKLWLEIHHQAEY